MPQRIPQYCLHKGSGQAYVKIDGRRIYLGVYDSPESHRRFKQEIARLEVRRTGKVPSDIRVGDLILLYQERHVREYYRKHGRPTSEQHIIKAALRFLVPNRHTLAADFGPRLLKAAQRDMIESGLSRKTVNEYVNRIKLLFQWAAPEQYVPAELPETHGTVKPLREGRSRAPDYEDVEPVPFRYVFAIRRFVNRQILAMVKLQLRTGMRPGEVVLMRTCDIDATGPVWLYRPHEHKLEHKRIPRVVEIGPRSQRVLRPFLRPDDPTAYLFSPLQAEVERGRPPAKNRRRGPGDRYETHSFRRAVERACAHAGIPAWTPNRLRHTFGTWSRMQGGLEATSALLGHKSVTTTERYAKPNQAAARVLALKIG